LSASVEIDTTTHNEGIEEMHSWKDAEQLTSSAELSKAIHLADSNINLLKKSRAI